MWSRAKLFKLWDKSSIPTVSRKRFLQLIKAHREKYLKLLRYPDFKKDENYNLKVEEFKVEIKKLFDISSCKCANFVEQCVCSKDHHKFPIKDLDFL